MENCHPSSQAACNRLEAGRRVLSHQFLKATRSGERQLMVLAHSLKETEGKRLFRCQAEVPKTQS
jgi:hypothetical protein